MTQQTATDRVRAALATRQSPARKDVEHALRETFGVSARIAKRFASEGYKALGVDDAGVDLSHLVERLRALESSINSK